MLTEMIEIHNTLNPKLWENNYLKREIKQRLLEIVDQFEQNLPFSLQIVDVRIVGSQASYNYSSKSDIDLHIVTNYELMDCSKEIAQALFDSTKSAFNKDYDITIKGLEVEVYVEDLDSNVASNGIYSLLSDSWIKFPKRLDNIPVYDTSKEVKEWTARCIHALESGSSQQVLKVINELYLLRKNSIALDGEYAKGNQVFKDIRNDGLLDALKKAYKSYRSKELTLESVQLNEDSRSALMSKSKKSAKGTQRFKKRLKSRVANSVKQFNAIDMDKLFKQDILTVEVAVQGETDNYTVKITFGGLLELLKEQIEKQGNVFNYKAVTRAMINGFNRDDVYIHCSCPDWQYRFAYYATKNNITSGDPENRPSDITNPDDSLGSGCKHVLLVLSNTSWLLKASAVVYNYVNYMQKHYQKLYADIIYPAIYGKEYEEPVQLDIFDDDTLATDSNTLDKSNEYARTKNQFKQGNKEGVRFASNSDDQANIFDDEEELQ